MSNFNIDEDMRQHKIKQLKLMRDLELNQHPDERYGATLFHWSDKPKAINLNEGALQTLIRYYENKGTETVVQETPAGTLIAKPWGEPDFPGIAIFLRYQDKDGKTQERMVSLTEYTSSESICGYDPMHPGTMARETAEVPQQRRNGDSVTPGIITRTWENLSDEDSDHKRTIHFVEDTKEPVKDWSRLVKMRNITSDEYDLLCDATNEDNDLIHWNEIYSITDTIHNENAYLRMIRGCSSARGSDCNGVAGYYNGFGFRPAFESLSLNDCADLVVGDVVVMGTLYVGDNAIKVPTNPTWTGDVTAYDKKGSGVTSEITLDTALNDAAYQAKAIYIGNGVFVCDRCMLNYISWRQIHAALSADKPAKDWSKLVKLRNITSDEYDLLCDVTNEDDDLMHWKNMLSWTDTIHNKNTSGRVLRGHSSARYSNGDSVTVYSSGLGFRPAFESLSPPANCADLSIGDVVVMGTLYVDGKALKVPTDPVYDGDVTAYDKNGSGITSKITLGTALKDAAYQVKAVYVGNGVFVCDRCMLKSISWEQIHAALSADKPAKDWSKLVKLRNMTSEDYDLLCDATNEDDSLMHWKNMYTITDTIYNKKVSSRVLRGYVSARNSDFITVSYYSLISGWRATFESMNPSTDCADLSVGDVVVMGTLYVGGEPLKVPTNPVQNSDGGNITAYDKNGFGITSKITLETALEDATYQVKAVYVGNGVFVCDRCALNCISWEQIHAVLS